MGTSFNLTILSGEAVGRGRGVAGCTARTTPDASRWKGCLRRVRSPPPHLITNHYPPQIWYDSMYNRGAGVVVPEGAVWSPQLVSYCASPLHADDTNAFVVVAKENLLTEANAPVDAGFAPYLYTLTARYRDGSVLWTNNLGYVPVWATATNSTPATSLGAGVASTANWPFTLGATAGRGLALSYPATATGAESTGDVPLTVLAYRCPAWDNFTSVTWAVLAVAVALSVIFVRFCGGYLASSIRVVHPRAANPPVGVKGWETGVGKEGREAPPPPPHWMTSALSSPRCWLPSPCPTGGGAAAPCAPPAPAPPLCCSVWCTRVPSSASCGWGFHPLGAPSPSCSGRCKTRFHCACEVRVLVMTCAVLVHHNSPLFPPFSAMRTT